MADRAPEPTPTWQRVTMSRTVVLLALAGIVSLTACSGDDDAATTTPAESVASTAATEPSTPATPPSTDDETGVDTGTSDPPSTTAPPPVTEPTATEPSDTTPELSPEERAVVEAMERSWSDLNAVLLDPTDDQLVAALAESRTGDALNAAVDLVANDRVAGRRSVTHPEVPATVTPYPDSVEIGPDGETAVVEYCRVGSNIYVEVGAAADGSDLVLDDSINSYRERDTFVLVDGRWLKSAGVTVTRFDGASTCPDL